MPIESASFSANWTGSVGVLMPMRTVASSGCGSWPFVTADALALADPPGVDVAAGVEPPQAATRPAIRMDENTARVMRKLIGDTSPPTWTGRYGPLANVPEDIYIVYNFARIRCARPIAPARRTHLRAPF